MVVIKTFAYRHEAEFVKGILTEKGIESVITADDCGGFRPHLTFTGRGAELSVKQEDIEKAREALKILGDNTKKEK